jgi:hypothetical protein
MHCRRPLDQRLEVRGRVETAQPLRPFSGDDAHHIHEVARAKTAGHGELHARIQASALPLGLEPVDRDGRLAAVGPAAAAAQGADEQLGMAGALRDQAHGSGNDGKNAVSIIN